MGDDCGDCGDCGSCDCDCGDGDCDCDDCCLLCCVDVDTAAAPTGDGGEIYSGVPVAENNVGGEQQMNDCCNCSNACPNLTCCPDDANCCCCCHFNNAKDRRHCITAFYMFIGFFGIVVFIVLVVFKVASEGARRS